MQQAELFVAAMRMMGHTVLGVGPTEARMINDYFSIASKAGLPVIAPESEEREGTLPYMVKEIGPVKVGVASFNSPLAVEDKFATSRKRLGAYAAARKESDILIVLDPSDTINEQWLQSMGKRYGEPDIVIGGPKYAGRTEPQFEGKTCIPPTSTRSTHVGLLNVELQPGQDPVYTFERVLMSDQVADDPEVTLLVKQFMEKQQVSGARPAEVPVVTSQAQHYATAETCKSCHETQYALWEKSGHAKALKTLMEQGKMMDECLKCHSEMYRQTRRYIASTNRATGVDCYSCHASVLPHGVGYVATGKSIKDATVCTDCHNSQHSPDFSLKSYMARVVHNPKGE